MKKLMITADDFGMCEPVNEAIRACIRAGTVRSTNVMVNMGCAEEAAALRESFPQLSLGIHFNLTVGQPVLPQERIPNLVDANGVFLPYKTLRRHYRTGKIKGREVVAEITAQLDRFIRRFGMPDYWNGHENFHMDFGLYPLVVQTVQRYPIRRMRCQEKLYVAPSGRDTMPLKWHLLNPVKSRIIRRWHAQSRRNGMRMPDGIVVCLDEEDEFDFAYLCKNLRWNGRETAEITIHPSTVGSGAYFGNLTEKRVREFRLYADAGLQRVADENGIALCGYRELGPGGESVRRSRF